MRRSILRFALQFVPLFIVALLLYPLVSPAYKSIVVALADLGVGALDPPLRLELSDDGGWSYFTGDRERYFHRPGANLELMFLSLALVPALLLATPVPLARRARMLGVGLGLLLALHVAAAVGLVVAVRCLVVRPDHLLCTWVKTVINIHGQLASIVIWGLLTWDVWLGRQADAVSDGR